MKTSAKPQNILDKPNKRILQKSGYSIILQEFNKIQLLLLKKNEDLIN